MIALFASSAALEDLRDTSHLTTEQQERFLDKLDSQYRYGSYVGGDGSEHIGMEKVPFRRCVKEVGILGIRVENEVVRRRSEVEIMGADTATERGMETEGGMEKETQKRYAHITLDVFEGGLRDPPLRLERTG